MSTFRRGALCVLIAATFSGAAIAAPCDGPSISPPPLAGVPLTLESALAHVRAASPDVRRAALETQARFADADQAGRWLNPSIGLEAENFSGSGPFSDYDQIETTFTLEQTFQLGGKRAKRETAARANASLGAATCQAILRNVELETAILFYELRAAVEVADLADEAAALAATFADTVAKRVNAGEAAPPELSRAQSDAATLKAAALAARVQIDQKRFMLAALWGSADPTFLPPSAQANLSRLNDLSGTVDTHPDLLVARASNELRVAERKAAKAAGMPDVTISAGIRQFEETDDNAFLVGVSVPIPLFDRNRDAARGAGYRADAERVNAAATEAQLRARQQSAAMQVRAAQARWSVLEQDALPAAQSAYEASVRGYAAGRFDLTSTLDARKGLIAAGVAVIDARRSLNTEMMQLNSLIGAAPFDGEL